MFSKDRYELVRDLIPQTVCSFVSNQVEILKSGNHLKYSDTQVEKAFCAYGLPVVERLLFALRPKFETMAQSSLLPTFSYLRVYTNGAILKKHYDRRSCEISVTLTLKKDVSTKNWPLFLETKKGIKSFSIGAGDGLIYEGQSLPHWRLPFEGENHIQAFLHYVREDGRNKHFKHDRRSGIVIDPFLEG